MADEESKNPEAEKPAESEAAPAPEAPAAKEEAPAAKEEAPAAKEEAPVAKEEAPAAKEEAPAAKEKAPAAKTDAPAAKEGAPAAKAEGGEKKEDEKKGSGEKGAGKDVFVSLGLEADESAPKILKAKGSKNVHAGIVHVIATFNNTLVTVTDLNGNVIGHWSSSGKMGFRGSRKSTAYAAQLVSQDACRQAMSHGLRQVEVRVKGPGGGRESAVRAVQAIGIEISTIKDVTPIPHNGCRPPKARRV